jgi:hypothetical protein
MALELGGHAVARFVGVEAAMDLIAASNQSRSARPGSNGLPRSIGRFDPTAIDKKNASAGALNDRARFCDCKNQGKRPLLAFRQPARRTFRVAHSRSAI